MATKTAQIIIQVDDKSLVELNQEIKALETSIQGLKVGTAEWVKQNQQLGTLKTQFSNVTKEAQKLQGQVQQIGSAEQIRAVAKLGAGMVGAFTATSGSIKALGIQSETFDEMTAKATTLMSIMGGLNQVAELFSTGTLSGLGAIGKGFGGLVRIVKTASLGIKTALISTGVGALIVGVGLLIANWDKLAKLVSGANKKELKAAEDKVKETEKELKLTLELNKQKKAELDANDKINSGKSKSYDEAYKAYELGKLATDEKVAELNAQNAIIENLNVELGQIKNKKTVSKQLKQDEIDIAVAKKKTLEAELNVLQATNSFNNITLQVVDSVTAVNNEIEKLQNTIIELNSEQDNSQEIYVKQLALINEQIKAIKLLVDENLNISDSDKKRIATLESQKKALKSQNDLRVAQLKTDIILLDNEISRNRFIDKYNQQLYESNKFINEQVNLERQREEVLKNNLDLIDLDLEGIKAGRQLRDSIVNFDLKRNKILDERLTELYPSELKITNEIYEQINRYLKKYGELGELKSFDFFKDTLKQLTEGFKANLTSQFALNIEYEKQTKFGKQIIDDASQDLAIKQITAEFQLNAVNGQITAVKIQQEEAKKLSESYNGITESLQQQLTVNDELLKAEKDKLPGKNAEERYRILQAINNLENNSAALQQQVNSANDDYANSLNDQVVLKKQLNDLEYKREEVITSVSTAEEKITKQLSDQLRLSNQLQGFLGKYNDEIQVGIDLLNQSFELVASIQDRKAETAQREIDAQNVLIDQQEELRKAEENRLSKIEKLQDEAMDANGSRYDELMKLIADEKAAQLTSIADIDAAEKASANIIKAKEIEKQEAEFKAARWRKAQAIVDAVIQGALGVIKALPNVFLAVATGVVAAGGVATIAAQKLPPKPESKEFGGLLKGNSHKQGGIKIEAEGGEYVINRQSTAKYLPVLESINNEGRKKFAEGGLTAPVSTSGQELIDYDRLAGLIMDGIIALPAPVVSVQKITTAQKEVSVTKQLAGLSR
jgi:hypothetical protein